VQRCVGEVLAVEADVKKGERWDLGGRVVPGWGLGAACVGDYSRWRAMRAQASASARAWWW
jgi:hypothetical protein